VHVRPILTLDAYFALEEAETVHRHEYWDGDIWAMTGTSPEHYELVLSLVTQLRAALGDGPCRAYSESIRTRVSKSKYTYPDVVAAWPPDFDRSRKPPILTNPKILVEVLSESTASFDRGDKLTAYRAIPTVTDIVLVSSIDVDVVHYVGHADGWHIRPVLREERLALEGISATLDLDAAYRAAGL